MSLQVWGRLAIDRSAKRRPVRIEVSNPGGFPEGVRYQKAAP